MKRLVSLLTLLLFALLLCLTACGRDGSSTNISDSYNNITVVRIVENIDGSTTIHYSDGSTKIINNNSFNNQSTAAP